MRTDPFQETFLKMVERAKSKDELLAIRQRNSEWLMGLQHSEPWLYGDMEDKILQRLARLP